MLLSVSAWPPLRLAVFSYHVLIYGWQIYEKSPVHGEVWDSKVVIFFSRLPVLVFIHVFPSIHDMDAVVWSRGSTSLDVVACVAGLRGVAHGIYMCLSTINESSLVFRGCQDEAAQYLAFGIETR